MRQTFLRERGERAWTVDDLVRYDVPAILDYVEHETGHHRVNWVGHSLGGMLVFPYLELAPQTRADRQLRRDGQHDHPGRRRHRPTCCGPTKDSGSSRLFASPGRLGRPLAFFRLPGMERIDRFYYSNENVDRLTVSRFYGYTLEDTGPGPCGSLHRISSMVICTLRIERSITRPCSARLPPRPS